MFNVTVPEPRAKPKPKVKHAKPKPKPKLNKPQGARARCSTQGANSLREWANSLQTGAN